MDKATVYFIDDQQQVREAITEMLGVFGYRVRSFASAETFLDTADGARGGCIVSDVRMPGMDGIQLVRECQKRGLGLPIILISGHADVSMAVQAIKAGAEDFIEKPVDDAALVAAINRGLFRGQEERDRLTLQRQLTERFERLTPRQAEVFDLVVEGCTSHAIAQRLDISARTVESYRAQIMEKMQADSVAVLVRQAVLIGRDRSEGR
jgi:two-component system, LuxR family, response regulator FixJ